MLNTIRKTIAQFIAPSQNSMSLPDEFLRYGSRKAMFPDWSEVTMNDRDHYTGYMYAAIKKRANKTARLATENVKTDSEGKDIVHPYLTIIDTSPTFSNYDFWYRISIFLDLKGWFPLMAVRNFDGNRMGNVQEFKMLNPYYVKPVYKDGTFELGGYVEIRAGMHREIPKEMIIPISELNPFDERKEYSMTDAAVGSSYTLKTAGDYTRHALKNNVNAPGIYSTSVVLNPERFKNFTERIKNHDKGEPLFGNGTGAIDYKDTSVDLSKATLKDINEQSVQELIAVSGMSKSMLGIEQSGVTRETSKVQREELTESELLPRIQMIIDCLNQDYKNNVPKVNRLDAKIIVDNPLRIDHESDAKETEVLTKRAELYDKLIANGYDAKKAALYVKGEIDIEELGEPDPAKARAIPATTPATTEKTVDDTSKKKVESIKHVHTASCGHDLQLNDRISGQVQQQEGALKNAIINVEEQVVAHAISKVSKAFNAFEETTDLVTKEERNGFVEEIAVILMGFYGIVMSLEGSRTMRSRMSKFSMTGIFSINNQVKKYMKETSTKVAEGHVDTIINDIWKTARDAAVEGKGQQQIINLLKQKYSDVITETRAKTVARSETNRAFTRAQYEADTQFVKQNKLDGRVFKQWRTRSSSPCDFCKELEREGLVPFNQSFRDLGGTVSADGKTLNINFETLRAGNLHPNCSCDYELIILPEQNSIANLDVVKSDLEAIAQSAKKELEK